MGVQKCPDCGANMLQKECHDGSFAFHCEYCGKNINLRPENAADRIFTFSKRVINAINESNERAIQKQKEEQQRKKEKRKEAISDLRKYLGI